MLTMALAAITGVLNAQEKYAVLITGPYSVVGIPPEEQWNNGEGKGPDELYYEFWNDTFLMWEMLVTKKGYSDENVFVLFAEGIDFTVANPWIDGRYNAQISYPDYYPITDYSAYIANVQAVFNGLRTGLNGFPLVTENDFLFVWTFDHGQSSGGNSYLRLMDGLMSDDAFAALVNPIPAHKKVFLSHPIDLIKSETLTGFLID